MRSLLPVARTTLPSSVPKNQYIRKTMPTEKAVPRTREPIVLESPRPSKGVSIVLTLNRGVLACPMTRMFME